MKALQQNDSVLEYNRNDAVMQETLVKIHAMLLDPNAQSIAHRILGRAQFDQLVLHLMSAPEHLLPSC